MNEFTKLGLSAPILKALDGEGYTSPTPIQAKSIPSVLEGRDLLGIAQTGTGKTAAFALPILDRLARDPRPAPRKGCRVLVLSPTRELASQIADSFKVYGRHMQLSVTTIFGGVTQRPQVKALARGVDVVVATPGRLLDLLGQRVAVLDGTEILVLDEADQMLDLGFVKPIRTIVSNLSSRRQTLFFSATMPKEITKLANEFLNDPVRVSVTPAATTVDRIKQRVIQVEAAKKRALLAQLLAGPEMARTIVFTRTKRGADRVAKHLTGTGIKVAAIHGNKSQRQREVALDAFRRSKIEVLVATDIAARGIDIDDITHVVNYELPEVAEAYVHRIGRTARAGATGSAISLCDVSERGLLRGIERLTRQTIPTEDRRNDGGLEIEKGAQRRADNVRSGNRFERPKSRDRQETGGNGRGPTRGGGLRNKTRNGGGDSEAGEAKRNGNRGSQGRPANRDNRGPAARSNRKRRRVHTARASANASQ